MHHSQIKIVFIHLSHPRITNIGSIAGQDLGGQEVETVCVVKTFLKQIVAKMGHMISMTCSWYSYKDFLKEKFLHVRRYT